MNKKRAQLIFFVAIAILPFIWLVCRVLNVTEERMLTETENRPVSMCSGSKVKICPDGKLISQNNADCTFDECVTMGVPAALDRPVEFNECGTLTKYMSSPWWEYYKKSVEKIPYYSGNQLRTVISNNRTQGSNGDTGEFCDTADSRYCDASSVQMMEVDSLEAQTVSNFEGCLSKDGSLFLSVFSGEYGGGGNHIFRYFTENDILEEAVKVDERTDQYSSWFSGPSSFGQRKGEVIEMRGGAGDAGCGATQTYEYDFGKNEIAWTKNCSACENEPWTCYEVKQGKVQWK